MKTTLAADKTIDGSLATIIDTENPTDLTKDSLMSMPFTNRYSIRHQKESYQDEHRVVSPRNWTHHFFQFRKKKY